MQGSRDGPMQGRMCNFWAVDSQRSPEEIELGIMTRKLRFIEGNTDIFSGQLAWREKSKDVKSCRTPRSGDGVRLRC